MDTIGKIRQAVDVQLDWMKVQLSTFEGQLRLTRDEALKQFEASKKKVDEAAEEVQSLVEKANGVAGETKAKARSAFDHLRVQLALGRAESLQAYEEQTKKLEAAVASFEAEVDKASAEADEDLSQARSEVYKRFVATSDALRAQQQAIAARFEQGEARAKAEIEKHQREIETQIADLRKRVDAQRENAAEKLGELKDEFTESVSKVRDAFGRLFR